MSAVKPYSFNLAPTATNMKQAHQSILLNFVNKKKLPDNHDSDSYNLKEASPEGNNWTDINSNFTPVAMTMQGMYVDWWWKKYSDPLLKAQKYL